MNDAKGGHGGRGRTTVNPLLSLHCVLRWRYLPFYKSDRPTDRPIELGCPPALQFPWHYTRPCQAVSSSPSSPHVAAARFVWQRKVRGDNRIRHRYTTNRERSGGGEVKEGRKEGGRRRCRGFHRAKGG